MLYITTMEIDIPSLTTYIINSTDEQYRQLQILMRLRQPPASNIGRPRGTGTGRNTPTKSTLPIGRPPKSGYPLDGRDISKMQAKELDTLDLDTLSDLDLMEYHRQRAIVGIQPEPENSDWALTIEEEIRLETILEENNLLHPHRRRYRESQPIPQSQPIHAPTPRYSPPARLLPLNGRDISTLSRQDLLSLNYQDTTIDTLMHMSLRSRREAVGLPAWFGQSATE